MEQIAILKNTNLCGFEFSVYGTAENPLFLARDVAEIIEHCDPHKMVLSVDEDERLTGTLLRSGQNRECWFLTEDGLYEVLMLSRKPIAKDFKRGVKTILKEIRTNGGYIAIGNNDTPETLMARALKVADETLKRYEEKIRMQSQKIEEAAPKVLFADAVSSSHTDVLIGDLAKLIAQNGVDMGQNRLFKKLREMGYLCSHGERLNLPAQRYIEQGLFRIKERTVVNPDGSVRITRTTMVTGKGQVYFCNMFLSEALIKRGREK